MSLKKLKKLMQILRSDEGCPWDRAQNFKKLKKFLLEETYEVLEAMEKNDREKLKEELGDLLFQIVFQSQLAEEEGSFCLEDVIESVHKKMIERHPHVFGGKKLKTKGEVLQKWELRKHKSSQGEINIPKALPALLKAYRLTVRARQLGFDWEKVNDIEKKLREELEEFCSIFKKNKNKAEEELGDILFVIANISRHLKIDPENALQKANNKFLKRLNFMLKKIRKENIDLKDLKIKEWDKYWEEAKKKI